MNILYCTLWLCFYILSGPQCSVLCKADLDNLRTVTFFFMTLWKQIV